MLLYSRFYISIRNSEFLHGIRAVFSLNPNLSRPPPSLAIFHSGHLISSGRLSLAIFPSGHLIPSGPPIFPLCLISHIRLSSLFSRPDSSIFPGTLVVLFSHSFPQYLKHDKIRNGLITNIQHHSTRIKGKFRNSKLWWQ